MRWTVAMKVRVLKIQTVKPFLAKRIPLETL
jgi:hypothetical protein